MTAAAAARDALLEEVAIRNYPVDGGSIIYKGTQVCQNELGFAVPASDTAGLSGVLGIALETRNNSAGNDGDTAVPVRSGCLANLVATSITAAMRGQMMFVVDDQTIDDTAGSTNKIPAGILHVFTSTTQGKVFIPLGGQHNRMSMVQR